MYVCHSVHLGSLYDVTSCLTARGLYPKGLCPGVFVWGFVLGFYVQWCLCPVGSLSRGSLSRACLCPMGICLGCVSVQGVSVQKRVSVKGMSLSRSVSVLGVSVQGGLCLGCLCPWVSVQGSLSRACLCPGGLCPGVCVRETPDQRPSHGKEWDILKRQSVA